MWENPYFQCRQPLIPVIVLIKNASFSITTNEEKHPPPQLHQLINALQKSDAKFVKLFGLFKFSRNIDTFVLLSPFLEPLPVTASISSENLQGVFLSSFPPNCFVMRHWVRADKFWNLLMNISFFPPLQFFVSAFVYWFFPKT